MTDHVSQINLNFSVFSFVVFNWILQATVFPVTGHGHDLDGIAGSFYVKCYFSEDTVVELTQSSTDSLNVMKYNVFLITDLSKMCFRGSVC